MADNFHEEAGHTIAEHEHGEGCGHQTVQHGDHVDYIHNGHRHALHEHHYDEHNPIAAHTAEEHEHGEGCGHEKVEHIGHFDYLHDGELHHLHRGDHYHIHELGQPS